MSGARTKREFPPTRGEDTRCVLGKGGVQLCPIEKKSRRKVSAFQPSWQLFRTWWKGYRAMWEGQRSPNFMQDSSWASCPPRLPPHLQHELPPGEAEDEPRGNSKKEQAS